MTKTKTAEMFSPDELQSLAQCLADAHGLYLECEIATALETPKLNGTARLKVARDFAGMAFEAHRMANKILDMAGTP